MVTSGPGPRLRGRRSESEALDELLTRARGGESAALVLRGEAGIGKTALLEYTVERADPAFRVARATGVESEMELPFAGLHQLCAPMLDSLDRIPGPQREALRAAFGLSAGERPDQFLVALAALSVLADVAARRPLLCVIDDAQWLDRASAQALAFVARRLLAESVVLLFAVRELGEWLVGLPELEVTGLAAGDARALLASAVQRRIDEQVRDRIVAETHGNPLALLELPRGLTAAELAGGFAQPTPTPLPGQIEKSFTRRLEQLPLDSQQLLLVAAADPLGDPALLWRAADHLGLRLDPAGPAQDAGLLRIGVRVEFPHPLVRSAVYRRAWP
jgi:hypothetical protein